MATITAIFEDSGGEISQQPPNQHLKQVAEDYIKKYGGLSLGNIDTPAFIRKAANISLKSRDGRLHREMLVEPDEKVVRFLAVLKGDLSLAG